MSELDPDLLKIFLTILAVAGIGISFLNFPGVILVFVAVFMYAWSTGFTDPSTTALIIAGVIAFLSLWIDNLAMILGAKKYGGTKWGMFGAAIGGIVGLFFGPIGIIIGPIAGAIALELIVNPDLKIALKSGVGTTLGYFIGLLAKLMITIIMFIWAMFVIW